MLKIKRAMAVCYCWCGGISYLGKASPLGHRGRPMSSNSLLTITLFLAQLVAYHGSRMTWYSVIKSWNQRRVLQAQLLRLIIKMIFIRWHKILPPKHNKCPLKLPAELVTFNLPITQSRTEPNGNEQLFH